ncbi:MAG: DNA polymerase I [Acidimicrobiales bacterium]
MSTILLLDGNNLAYRAFFALPTDMATASGQVTNAVFGFTSMLVNLLKDHRPDQIAVAFDRPEPTFRHEQVVDYKAGRAETPDILRQQLGLVRQVVEALRIPVVEAPGFEADDVIATLATRARDRGDDVLVVTGDRDCYQLVEDPLVKVLYNRRGVSDYVLYDEAGILERTGVVPAKYPEYAALRGDPSDNLPGVPGVGEKKAAQLLDRFGDLDGIFANLGSATPKLRENLAASESQVRSNAAVIPLVRDVPLEVELDELHMGGWDPEEVRRLFTFLEFRSLWDRLVEALGEDGRALQPQPEAEALAVEVEAPTTAAGAVAALAVLREQVGATVAVEPAWKGQAGRSALEGLALALDPGEEPGAGESGRTGDEGRAVWIGARLLGAEEVRQGLGGLVGPGGVQVTAHRAKELMRALLPMGVDVAGLGVDTALAAYLVEPSDTLYDLPDLAARFAGIDVQAPAAAPPGQLALVDAEPGQRAGPAQEADPGQVTGPAQEAGRRAVALTRLAPALREVLRARRLESLYDDIERPLVRVLARMEVAGVRVDVAYLGELVATLTDEAARLDAEIQELAGEAFVVNSTPQLRRILYERLGLAPHRRTKTGFSTDAASLERLRGQHPIVDSLLRYREVEKLRSTYGQSLVDEVGADGRIHASFNQTVARTGRLSSDQPNLHNIPVRSEEGRRFRRAFIPADGYRLLVADYNQIELRVIAHLAEDPGLIEAFELGTDIHRATAARVFGVPPAEVNPAQRAKAKMVSYGLAYGMESYGLARRLAIPVPEAEGILGAYFEAFPKVSAYMDATVAEARDKGYTETLFGRRRQIPELSSSNYRIRQAGERQAMNAGIQGLAADIFKVALVRLDAGLPSLRSRLILQVHDEVILEVPPEEADQAAALTLEAMRGAASLRVPLEVNLSWGSSWAEAKG